MYECLPIPQFCLDFLEVYGSLFVNVCACVCFLLPHKLLHNYDSSKLKVWYDGVLNRILTRRFCFYGCGGQ